MFSCSTCRQEFVTKNQLKTHESCEHKPVYECCTCARRFLCSGRLDEHLSSPHIRVPWNQHTPRSGFQGTPGRQSSTSRSASARSPATPNSCQSSSIDMSARASRRRSSSRGFTRRSARERPPVCDFKATPTRNAIKMPLNTPQHIGSSTPFRDSSFTRRRSLSLDRVCEVEAPSSMKIVDYSSSMDSSEIEWLETNTNLLTLTPSSPPIGDAVDCVDDLCEQLSRSLILLPALDMLSRLRSPQISLRGSSDIRDSCTIMLSPTPHVLSPIRSPKSEATSVQDGGCSSVDAGSKVPLVDSVPDLIRRLDDLFDNPAPFVSRQFYRRFNYKKTLKYFEQFSAFK